MWKVLFRGTLAATIIYFIAGVMGYTTFALYPNCASIMEDQNILKAPY